jgi:predicted glycosyl hydrolase (DUF1957 family)
MADADPDDVAETPPRQLAREVVAPPVRRRWVIALAIVVAVGGAGVARLRWHHHHRATHECVDAATRARVELQILDRTERAIERLEEITEQLRPRRSFGEFGDLGAADLAGPTRVK